VHCTYNFSIFDDLSPQFTSVYFFLGSDVKCLTVLYGYSDKVKIDEH